MANPWIDNRRADNDTTNQHAYIHQNHDQRGLRPKTNTTLRVKVTMRALEGPSQKERCKVGAHN